MTKSIFFIAGMHRSGTSLLAETLGIMGLEFPESIQPGAPDNPKGHFESLRVSQYHDSLLSELNSSWDTFISPPESWFSSEYAEKAIQDLIIRIKSDFPGDGPFVLKDPRISVFIPLWREISSKLELQDYYIISLRHPLGVAASLDKRNKIGKVRALLIWLNYLFNAEKSTRGCKRTFVHFPEWSEDLELTIDNIESDLGVGLPKKNKRNMVKAEKVFESDLVHYKEPATDLPHNDIESLSFETYETFINLTKDPNDIKLVNKLDWLNTKFNEVSSVFAEVYFELERRKKIELEQQLAKSQSEKEESTTHVTILQEKLAAATTHSTELEQQMVTSQSEKEESTTHVTILQEKLAAATTHSTELEQQLVTSQSEKEESRSHVTILQEKLAAATTHSTELEQQLVTSQNEINDMKAKNLSLVKEYEELLLKYNKEQLTVMRPLYKNVYKSAGVMLRSALPSAWVESIKKCIPNPEGIPRKLTYQPQLLKAVSMSSSQFLPPMIDSAPDMFVLSIINWDFRYQRPQHIAKGMSESGRRVFYVEMDLVDKETQCIKVTDNLYRVKLSSQTTGHIHPYIGQPVQEQLEAWISEFIEFCNTVKATSFKQIVIQHPFWWQLARHLSPEFEIIFDCMDDIGGFSNTEKFLLDLEKDMLQKCDKLIVSSQYLFDKYKHFQEPHLIRNAAELEHFSEIKKGRPSLSFLKLPIPRECAGKIINVGYVGAIAEWFDAELIRATALNESNIVFHFCGEVTTKEAAQLDELENINMYGEIPYSEVPGFLNVMDVLIIPFKLVPIIQACDPVKFYEYSAMGKPTVTTALPELKRADKLTFVASAPEEFAEQIHNAYKAGNKRDFRNQLQEYAKNNTWKHRIAQLEEILSTAPKVSIVILSYGDPELTKVALHSLYDGGPNYPNMEVLIVDNGSPENELAEINEFSDSYTDVKVIENGENLGFAKGNNVGLKAATGDYVMLLNNDTVVSPGAVYAMVRHLIHNPSIGAVGPLTNNIGNEAKLFVDYEDMEQMKDIARQVTTGYRSVYTPINVTAYFAVMFRREDLKTFGLLADDYGRGMFEDDDHCAVIKSKGYICALAEDAYIHHHLSATFSKLKDDEKEELFKANKVKYENKWGEWKPHKYRKNRPEPSHANQGK